MGLLKKPLKKQSGLSLLNALSTPSTKSEAVGRTLTSKSRLGDIAEHYGIKWLWDEGFEVFHNSGCTGEVDIVALKNDEVYLIDVKTLYQIEDGVFDIKSCRTEKQKEMGVQLLGFNPVTRKLRMINHHGS